MRRTMFALAIASTLALPAFAGAPPPVATPVPTAPAAGRHDEIRARVQEKIGAFITGELTSRLSLDAGKSAKLSDAVKAFQERKQQRHKTMKDALAKLQQLVDSKASDAQLKSQLDVVIGAKMSDDDIAGFVNDTSKFLSVQEQAKLALAMPDIMKDVGKMMREAHREMRGKAGPGGFGGREEEE